VTNLEAIKMELKAEGNLEILEFVEGCDYICNAGPLKNNLAWAELKRRANEQACEPDKPIIKEPTYIDRMRTESYELGIKIEKASAFIEKEIKEPKYLDGMQRQLLKKQLEAMKAYHDVLMTRITYEGEDD